MSSYGSNQVSRNPYAAYYLRDTVQSQLNQLEATSAVAPNIQTTNCIASWATSATGPNSDHNLLNNTTVVIDQDNNLILATPYATIGMIGPTGTYATGPTGSIGALATPIVSLPGGEPSNGDFGYNLSLGMYNGGAIPTNPDTTLYNNTLLVGFNNYNTGLTGLTGSGVTGADEYDGNIIMGCNNVTDMQSLDFYENTIIGNNILNTTIDDTSVVTNNVIMGYEVANNITSSLNENVIIGSGTMVNSTADTDQNVIIGYSTMRQAEGTLIGNIVIGSQAGNNLSGTCQSNIGIGIYSLGQYPSGVNNYINSNVCVGDRTGLLLSNGAQWNTLIGTESGQSLTGVTGNCCIGGNLSYANGNNNTIVGYRAMSCTGTVSNCSVLGRANVQGITGGTYSNNLYLDPNVEIGPESNVIRAGNASHTKCFINGIRSITTVNNDAIAVLIDSAGQLGTVSSSAKYKRNIEDLDYNATSNIISQLRPTKFNHINCDGEIQEKKSLGLIAEEVEKIYPDMCIYQPNECGERELLTVDYNRLIIMLLSEVKQLRFELNNLKQVNKFEELQKLGGKSVYTSGCKP
jgi:hypothetical protein